MLAGRAGFQLVLAGVLLAGASGCTGGEARTRPPVAYPNAPEVLTTRQRIVLPDASPWGAPTIFPHELSRYEAAGYGTWRLAAGYDAGRRLDLMPPGYTGAQVSGAARLASLFAFSDIHVGDEESPAQAVNFGWQGGSSSAYSGVMLYTTQVLDAAVQTVNAIHRERPIDFGLSLGDVTNNNQHDELRWYLDVMDGRVVRPDSGDEDDPIPGPGNDHQDPFQAAGLDPAIAWYQVRGNHDDLWMGTAPVTDRIRAAYTGDLILELGDVFTAPEGIESHGFYMGALDGRTPFGDVFGAGPVDTFPSPPRVPAADPDRRPLSRPEYLEEFLGSTSRPAGHGFTADAVAADSASYTFEPMATLPLKVIVLDDTQPADDFALHGQGYLGADRLAWLLAELEAGQAEGKLMIIAAHVPLTYVNWRRAAPLLTAAEIAARLNAYPNLVAWLSGHVHRSNVTARPSLDPARPASAGHGFWEIWNPSLRDFPQQFRLIELVRNSDATLSIFLTNVDPAVAEGSLAATSRRYAVASHQLFRATVEPGTGGAYNAELLKPLGPALREALQGLGTPLPR
ncbi:MAG: TIGR03768 family metallophosphoesterase [Anaeromyxobacter sp.]|nr:TIGR03768 family metallophosphoesterase [Anaeromyxobacter sp.]MBL0276897.1 TIGR03768 family metallophosphoesterase [Anaeromyxobacter sp.]